MLEEVSLLVKKEKIFSELEMEEIIAWLKGPEQYQWNFALEEQSMSSLIHLFYIIFCYIPGPIDTDKIFHQVLDDCKQIPASKQFSPARFL